MVAHIPGLKVVFPATPYDAKGMLNLALRGTDPVVFFESQRLYAEPETLVARAACPTGYYEVPMGEPAVRREGSDLTIVTIGATLYRALEAAEELEEKYGLSAEVIDARFINPLNYEPIVESVKKTGKVVLASDACERGSFLHTMASQHHPAGLRLPGRPAGRRRRAQLDHARRRAGRRVLPAEEWIIDTIHERILPLPGHKVTARVQATARSCGAIAGRVRARPVQPYAVKLGLMITKPWRAEEASPQPEGLSTYLARRFSAGHYLDQRNTV